MAMKKVSAQRGFTLIELVTILIIVGILAVFVIGRLTTSTFSQRALSDKVISSIEYARKYGVAHRRYVCVRTAGNVITFTLDPTAPEQRSPVGGACPTNQAVSELALPLAAPDSKCSSVNVVCVPSGSYTLIASVPTLTFDATGGNITTVAGNAATFTVTGPASTTSTVKVEGVTGYVH
jgi:prepilin-type N-terminal cleavage/methylation domain-containing protein